MKMEAQIRIRQTGKCNEIPEDPYNARAIPNNEDSSNDAERKNIPRIHIITSTDSSSHMRM